MQKKNQSNTKNIVPLISVNLTPNLAVEQQQSHSQLLIKTYPHIAALNSLRIFTTLEIIYLLELYIDLIEKNGFAVLANIRVGIIGGGITARILLNSILPFSKDGLDLKNITISTRQPQNFKHYAQTYGIRVLFDNQLTARQSDFLVIATPATLDNWIITDLKDSLDQRIRECDKTGKGLNGLTPLLMEKNALEKVQLMTGHNLVGTFGRQGNSVLPQKSAANEQTPQKKRSYRPLVYILTSDFSQQKCQKIFNFPVLTPSIRAKDIDTIAETFKLFVQQKGETDQHQKLLIWWLTKEIEVKKQSMRLDSHQSKSDAEIEGLNLNEIESILIKYAKTPFFRIVKALAFVVSSSKNLTSLSSSASNTISISSSLKDNHQQQQSFQQVIESATAHGLIDKTFYLKIKKWKMAYNNFIA